MLKNNLTRVYQVDPPSSDEKKNSTNCVSSSIFPSYIAMLGLTTYSKTISTAYWDMALHRVYLMEPLSFFLYKPCFISGLSLVYCSYTFQHLFQQIFSHISTNCCRTRSHVSITFMHMILMRSVSTTRARRPRAVPFRRSLRRHTCLLCAFPTRQPMFLRFCFVGLC